jgi:signal peptidase II
MLYYGITIGLVLLDQASKKYMSSILPLCQPGYCKSIDILPVFKFTVVHNEGAAFSFLSDAGGWQRWVLVLISSLVSTFLAVWLYRVSRREKLLALALAFILGGALGNLVDRALQGYVVDFLVVYYDQYYFPAFNVADSSISVGAGLLILDMFYKPGGKADA